MALKQRAEGYHSEAGALESRLALIKAQRNKLLAAFEGLAGTHMMLQHCSQSLEMPASLSTPALPPLSLSPSLSQSPPLSLSVDAPAIFISPALFPSPSPTAMPTPVPIYFTTPISSFALPRLNLSLFVALVTSCSLPFSMYSSNPKPASLPSVRPGTLHLT